MNFGNSSQIPRNICKLAPDFHCSIL